MLEPCGFDPLVRYTNFVDEDLRRVSGVEQDISESHQNMFFFTPTTKLNGGILVSKCCLPVDTILCDYVLNAFKDINDTFF